MAIPWTSPSSSRRRGKFRASGNAAGFGILVLLGVSVCLIRLTLRLIAASGAASSPSRIASTVMRNSFEAGNSSLQPSSVHVNDVEKRDQSGEFDFLNELLDKYRKVRRDDNGPYHKKRLFLEDYKEMTRTLKVFVYPCAEKDPMKDIFLPSASEPGGNYASEAYFKKALADSGMVTTDPTQAHFFYMPFSIARLRHNPKVGVGRIRDFIRDYVNKIVHEWPFWNRTGGSDHFYVACHSIGKIALDHVEQAKLNAIQVVCSSNYFVQGFIPHKDVTIPQVWPRQGNPTDAKRTDQRKVLAFYAGAANSPVRANLVGTWRNDSSIRVFGSRISTPYSEALLTSKFCLHVKGFEVNTARLADALFYGCVPVVIANHYDLPFNSVLNWSSFSLIVTTADIPLLKNILSQINSQEYNRMHKLVLEVRRHFQWHSPPREFDAFYMVMYQLWLRRHILRFSL